MKSLKKDQWDHFPKYDEGVLNPRKRIRKCRSSSLQGYYVNVFTNRLSNAHKGKGTSFHTFKPKVLGRWGPLNMTVNNLQNDAVPWSFTPSPVQGPNQAGRGNELETEEYDENLE